MWIYDGAKAAKSRKTEAINNEPESTLLDDKSRWLRRLDKREMLICDR